MNARDITKVAPGVVRRFDGKRAIYGGTAESLIAAGLVEEKQLPGQTGMARGMCTIGTTQVVALPMLRGTRYEVRVRLSQQRIDGMAWAPRSAAEPQAPAWPFPQSIGRSLAPEEHA